MSDPVRPDAETERDAHGPALGDGALDRELRRMALLHRREVDRLRGRRPGAVPALPTRV